MSKDYGFKISKSGYDVKTATDKNLIVSSKYKTLTIASSGTQNVVISSGDYWEDEFIAHGLGYVPAVVVYGKKSTDNEYVIVPYAYAAFDIGDFFLKLLIDDTYLRLVVEHGSGAPANTTFNFKYYIFNNQIE
jgi:hypothetical protein